MANIVAGGNERGRLTANQRKDSRTRLVPVTGLKRLKKLFISCWSAPLGRRKNRAPAAPRASQPSSDIAALFPGNCVVVRDVASRYGRINHLVIGENGAVFLIETISREGKITEENGELRHNGHPFEKDLIRQTTTNAFGLREVLEDGLGISPRINAAIVFPKASVAVARAVYGVEIIQAADLQQWMAKARGNPEVARLISHIS